MRCTTLLLAASLAAAPCIIACDAGASDGAGSPPGEAAPYTPPVGPAPFEPEPGSDVSGTVVAEPLEGDLTVTVSVEGLEPGDEYMAYLHSGGCADGGALLAPLGRIRAGEEGSATVRLRTAAGDLPHDRPASVRVHAASGQALACAPVGRR
jgi:hypothetical protein